MNSNNLPLSTYKILAEMAYYELLLPDCVDWAVEMVWAGFESDNLLMIASLSKPYNQFELKDLMTKALKDLNLDFSNKEKVLDDYVYSIVKTNLNYPENYFNILKECDTLSIINYYEVLRNFSDLYNAKYSLIDSTVQFYVPNVDRENIDQTIRDEFEKFILEYEKSN